MEIDLLNNKDTAKEIDRMIEKRIEDHANEHDGLYTPLELEQLRPVWRKHLLKRLENAGLTVIKL